MVIMNVANLLLKLTCLTMHEESEYGIYPNDHVESCLMSHNCHHEHHNNNRAQCDRGAEVQLINEVGRPQQSANGGGIVGSYLRTRGRDCLNLDANVAGSHRE